MLPLFPIAASFLRRQSDSGGCGTLGCFGVILIIGLVLFFLLRGRRDRPELLGASKRAMGSGPIADHTFVPPFAKCPTCSAAGDKMKQQWDGLRKVTWTCGYCGNLAGVQELKDEELPPSARQRLGLDLPRTGLGPDHPGGSPGQGGVGGLLTGMMLGSMLGGHHNPRSDDWGGSGSGSDSSHDSDTGGWGDGGSSGGDSGGDWGDSGGGDAGGGDSGGGDW
jgi:hypothetical protein